MADVDDALGGVAPLPLGAVMGHEFAGHVVAAAADVRAAWRDGERVPPCRRSAAERARPPVIFDCVGVPDSLQLAMDYAPVDGRIVVAGVCMQPDRVLPVKAITKEWQLNFVYVCCRRDFAFTVDMLAAGRIDPRPDPPFEA